jgi:predicted CXXCH cytochrome family protein
MSGDVQRLSWFSGLMLAAFCAMFLAAAVVSSRGASPTGTAPRAPDTTDHVADFVGSSVCSECHAVEHKDWQGSQHAIAMQEATEQTVLGRFDGATFTKDGLESTFFRKDGKFWVRTDGPGGKLDDFEIKYTFGIAPLQQYLIALPGGRLQALGIAWDARPAAEGGQRWYHLYPEQKLTHKDPLHWTGIDQNWNYQCAWCHSTNLRKNYDAAAGTFNTVWSEISVGCEACHGPASKHIAWAKKADGWESTESEGKGFGLKFDQRAGVTWSADKDGRPQRSSAPGTDKEVQMCAGCHARRQQFSDDPHDVLGFDSAFRPMTLDAGLYHADGQQSDEVYTYGSFLQSRMHNAGVTCSDCHNPHTGKLRQTGNTVCTQCHAAERFDVEAHHHHAQGTAGAQCAACHMPVTTYMGVDARHDHSMRIPRPDRTVTLGTPNACNACHKDQTAAWASNAVKTWYPMPKSGFQDFAEAFDLGDKAGPGAQASLQAIATSQSASPIARASAIARLNQFPSPQLIETAIQSLKDQDAMVRAAAVAVLAEAEPQQRRILLAPLLQDSSRIVRMDVARALAGVAESDLTAAERALFETGLGEYVSAQTFNAERPESHANLGSLNRDRGRLEEAKAAFAKSLEIDPTFAPAAISLADLARSEGNEASAEAILRKFLSANPNSAPAKHALGLGLIRQKRVQEAIALLADAVRIAPTDPRFAYVYAVALHDTGSAAKAIDVLRQSLSRSPNDRDILMALLSYEIEAQDFASALGRAELMMRLEPDRPEISQLADKLRARVKQR